ncbi:MAG: hypothetical protein DMG70_00080 [Acidobacteria bacterium]|nr:MAG: hypothetical protein DMG70_00080 [Acidobacteriota bacterium]PYY12648.1 MAG: hypothetical protein DMG69_00490 [Acidobacteriota bacterium]
MLFSANPTTLLCACCISSTHQLLLNANCFRKNKISALTAARGRTVAKTKPVQSNHGSEMKFIAPRKKGPVVAQGSVITSQDRTDAALLRTSPFSLPPSCRRLSHGGKI